jgi:hypothetical protein
MKINEIVLDWLGRTRLYEMTKSRADGKNALRENSYNIAEHLVKLIMFGSRARDYRHWCKELNSWLSPLNKIRVEPKNKRFEFSVINEFLWKSWLGSVEEVQDHMEDLEQQYRKSLRMVVIDPQVVHKIIMNIMTEVCYDLSNGNFTKIQDYLQ